MSENEKPASETCAVCGSDKSALHHNGMNTSTNYRHAFVAKPAPAAVDTSALRALRASVGLRGPVEAGRQSIGANGVSGLFEWYSGDDEDASNFGALLAAAVNALPSLLDAYDALAAVRGERDAFRARAESAERMLKAAPGTIRAADVRLRAIGDLLEQNGCDCECDHHPEEHADDCDRCLACRINDALGPDYSVSSEQLSRAEEEYKPARTALIADRDALRAELSAARAEVERVKADLAECDASQKNAWAHQREWKARAEAAEAERDSARSAQQATQRIAEHIAHVNRGFEIDLAAARADLNRTVHERDKTISQLRGVECELSAAVAKNEAAEKRVAALVYSLFEHECTCGLDAARKAAGLP